MIRSADYAVSVTMDTIDATANGDNYPLNAISTLMYKGAANVCITPYATAEGFVYEVTEVLAVTAESAE